MAEDIKNFLKDIEQQTGAQIFVMVGFERPSGSVAITKYAKQKQCIIQNSFVIIDFKQGPDTATSLPKQYQSGRVRHGITGKHMLLISTVCLPNDV